MTRPAFTPHFRVATLLERTVGELRFTAIASTDPQRPFQVATYDRHGFVLPGSISIHQNPAAAIAAVDQRADEAEEELPPHAIM